MPKPQSMPSRQRPVSCRFCRSRKLRCDREVPCSNCVSRGISCELELAVRSSSRGTGALEPELVERVRMLEELVGSRKSQPDDAAKQQERNDADVYGEQASRSSLSPQIDHLDNDVAWLESIYSDQNASDKMPSNRMLFKVCPIQQIMEAPLYINQSTFMTTRFEPSRCVWLPQHSEAKILLDKYIQDIDHHHHIVHTPSLPLIIDDFYTTLNQQGQVNPGVVILLLGIFASSTYSWAAPDCERGLFSQPVEANNQWPLWIRSLEDVLDIAHRTTTVSIEGIQGAIISFWVVFNTDGLTRRGRSLWNIAFSLARELKLHCLDHSSNANLANCARTEIKRRIWWYLVASDWSASSRFAGANQGVYQCHVRQMIVRKPLNLNDEDLVDGMSLVERPLSQPTTMSYSILRIRLGEISRNITDRTAFIMAQSSIPYHVIMDIDTELQLLLNDVPRYFSMPVADLIKTYQLDPSRAESIAYQGYMFSTLFYSQRCIIHFPYYGRGFVDQAYASSRDICLQSACLIIQTEVKFKESRLWNATRFKYLGLFVAVFMASIVLLMHQCYNKGFPRDEAQRRVLADAMGILEEGRHESETTSKFLDSLMQILRKHLMPPTQSASSQPIDPIIGREDVSTSSEQAINNPAATKTYSNDVPMESLPVTATGALEHAKLPDLNFSGDRQGVEENMSSYFTELALNFEQGIDFSNFDWDNIFSGLDSPFV